ncbi:MAG: carbohydrate kinase, partial [Bacilli bacterium]|nr:carbohydrate kinase [Bacilli bacterium]
EFTNFSTTQLYNPTEQRLDPLLLEKLNLPQHVFSELVQPGTLAGQLQDSVCEELGINPVPVVAVAEHDTASAVVAVPAADGPFAYLSCGTWSLIGTELQKPILDERALRWNFTNEGGVHNTFRFLKNIMGLWLLQECKREWEKQGKPFTFSQLTRQAEDAPAFRFFIDPDDPGFLNPVHMPQQIQQFCELTHQPVPQTEGEIIRCVTESLALQYRVSLERIELLTGNKFAGLHMVGGGIQNELLCQFTANALGRPVWAGPAEGSAIGNLLVQMMAMGEIKTLQEARNIVRNSFPIKVYEPQHVQEWASAFERYQQLLRAIRC